VKLTTYIGQYKQNTICTGRILAGKVFRIGTVRCNWPMSAHASQAFSVAHCTDSEDLPLGV